MWFFYYFFIWLSIRFNYLWASSVPCILIMFQTIVQRRLWIPRKLLVKNTNHSLKMRAFNFLDFFSSLWSERVNTTWKCSKKTLANQNWHYILRQRNFHGIWKLKYLQKCCFSWLEKQIYFWSIPHISGLPKKN